MGGTAMPAAASPLTAAYDRLAAVFPGLTVTELGPDDPAPCGPECRRLSPSTSMPVSNEALGDVYIGRLPRY
ncbi:hypothetical protein AB0N19_35695, partial [Streptomyces sp. NPDC051132]